MRTGRSFMLALSVWLGLGVSIASADPGALIGAQAPPVRARALDSDEPVSLERYRGQVMVLAFVATWCQACRRAAPQLEALEAANPGLTVLALTYEDRVRVRQHVARDPRRYRWVQCTGHTAVSYGADALPTLVVVDRSGRVAAAYQGASPEIFASLQRDVARLLAETRSP